MSRKLIEQVLEPKKLHTTNPYILVLIMDGFFNESNPTLIEKNIANPKIMIKTNNKTVQQTSSKHNQQK